MKVETYLIISREMTREEALASVEAELDVHNIRELRAVRDGIVAGLPLYDLERVYTHKNPVCSRCGSVYHKKGLRLKNNDDRQASGRKQLLSLYRCPCCQLANARSKAAGGCGVPYHYTLRTADSLPHTQVASEVLEDQLMAEPACAYVYGDTYVLYTLLTSLLDGLCQACSSGRAYLRHLEQGARRRPGGRWHLAEVMSDIAWTLKVHRTGAGENWFAFFKAQ